MLFGDLKSIRGLFTESNADFSLLLNLILLSTMTTRSRVADIYDALAWYRPHTPEDR
ncbi:hypothetical protein F8B43_1337 [Methylorubrum populi]|uniref:Uncharacterized protein n=1 Tax=Methylorubrum populi TaxID=223967 RepID=A0A833J9N4_9HYPH|nr:hypothetical protein F8B43_1337 [Methylorubrum populi]